MVDLVEEILDDDGVVVLCILIPCVEARRRMAPSAFAIGGCASVHVFGPPRHDSVELGVCILEQVVDRVATGIASARHPHGAHSVRGRGVP